MEGGNVGNFRKRMAGEDDNSCHYVYAQTMNGKTQYGLAVGAYVPDYMKMGLLRSMNSLVADKEEDRMKHVRVNNAKYRNRCFLCILKMKRLTADCCQICS